MGWARRIRPSRVLAIALMCIAGMLPTYAPGASGQSLGDLRDRMDSLRARLASLTRRVDELYARQGALDTRIANIERRIEAARGRMTKLEKSAVRRADALYRSGGMEVVEALFAADSFVDLSARAEMLSQVSIDESGVFTQLYRTQAELKELGTHLRADREELARTRSELEEATADLQSEFDEVAGEYEHLRDRIAAQQRAANAASAVAQPAAAPTTGGMACPVDGPVSFTDTWGAPRSGGRSHQGVDMMAPYGTPVAAIVSGTITYAGYGSSAGNWQILSGDDGNSYWYMHNQRNTVAGGRVSAGQHIATVGDTGNATGTPHLHFEYHPGGGAAVNPTPLVSSVC